MDSTERLFEILEDYRLENITSTHAVQQIKQVFLDKLEPYIGDDYDMARKILAR